MPSVQLPAAFPSLLPWEGVPCPAQLSAALRPHPAPLLAGAAAPSLPPHTRGQAPSCRARPQSPFPSLAPRGAQGQTAKSRNCKKPPDRACLYMARDLQCRRFVYAHVRTGALPQLATTALVYYKQNKLLFRAGSFLLWNQSPFQKMAQCTLESLPV